MKLNADMNLGFGVNVRPIVMRDEEVVREYPLQHNLVLDSGLEMLATNYTADCFLYAHIGIGDAPTERSSGAVTVTKSGDVITASAPLFDQVASGGAGSDEDRVLRFDTTGVVVTLLADVGNSATVYKCDVSGIISASETCTIYNVEQTQLETSVQSSNTYRDTGNGENGFSDENMLEERLGAGATYSSGTGILTDTIGDMNFTTADIGKLVWVSSAAQDHARITGWVSATQVNISEGVYEGASQPMAIGRYQICRRWRTFEYPNEIGTVTYKEAGWAPSSSPTLLGRIVFDTPVEVNAGERLLLYVELNTYVNTDIANIAALPITNLGVAAKSVTPFNQVSGQQFSGVAAAGTTILMTTYYGLSEPLTPSSDITYFMLSDRPTAIEVLDILPLNSGLRIVTEVIQTADSYIAGTYYKTWNCFFPAGVVDLSSNAWTEICMSGSSNSATIAFRIVFDTPQSFTLTNTLEIDFKKSWTRYFGDA